MTPEAATAPFTAHLWASTEPLYQAILRHPFLTGLTDGTLPRAAFAQFVVQDSLYLRDYARALAVCAAKAPTEADVRALATDAAEAVAAEQAMHADFRNALAGTGHPGLRPGPGPEDAPDAGSARPVPPAPTTLAYTSYLLATVYGDSFLAGLAAVLPCYWVYARLGAELLAASSPDPLYARWIAAYGDPAFQAVAQRVIALTDRVGAEASPAERSRAARHFAVTTRYEWMFWDAAWRAETWPV
ncbi:TenA family protein [Frankia sp. AgKG'84/4]|uniref:TenA family protein n=1 Tax=Frankia sp. AgKG'84/4 TaxID=573490 RepID=UPI00200D6679|nr:TenA family protein [Frankia sp. AgKG'84/4]MCL9795282.1 TenA family protein [Frankia sp. AgKG'84/4]